MPPIPAADSLPPPVARYLAHVLGAERRDIRLARYQQSGTLRTDTSGERWMAFHASQIIAPRSREVLWGARVSLWGALHLRVRDSLMAGRGAGQLALLSAIPVAHASGDPEMDSGALHRFLAEAPWYPSVLRPGPARDCTGCHWARTAHWRRWCTPGPR